MQKEEACCFWRNGEEKYKKKTDRSDEVERVYLYDTTLRDGAQRAGITYSLLDKERIAELLDANAIDYIEGGWPLSNPKDQAFFEKVVGRLKYARLTAFGSTARKQNRPEEDPNLLALLATGVDTVTIFGKSSRFQAEKVLEVSVDTNLRMIHDSVQFLVESGVEVLFDAEHFFDGYKEDEGYALAVVAAAHAGGARWQVLCDTNGGALPMEVARIVSRLQSLGYSLGIHAHNDAGLAVANSLMAVDSGARMVQGTINGYGERCGNADLITIWANLVTKMGYRVSEKATLKNLTHVSRYVAETANIQPDASAPFVGENAFTHKAGVHVGAIRKHPEAYEHMDPVGVGNLRKVLVSEQAGRSNLLYLYPHLNPQAPEVKTLLERIKGLENQGYQLEGAETTLDLLVRESQGSLPSFFTLEGFRVWVEKRERTVSEASVKLKIHDHMILEVAEGDGPVNALDNALRKALLNDYPELKHLRLIDYKVRVLDGKAATASMTRVLVESFWHEESLRTVGVSNNILEASWLAVTDAMRYALLRHRESRSEVSLPL